MNIMLRQAYLMPLIYGVSDYFCFVDIFLHSVSNNLMYDLTFYDFFLKRDEISLSRVLIHWTIKR